MPYKFRFFVKDNLLFSSKLKCERCTGKKKNGDQCLKSVCIGLPYCYQHLKLMKLRIGTSKIRNAGKGLFAYLPSKKKQSNRKTQRNRIPSPVERIPIPVDNNVTRRRSNRLEAKRIITEQIQLENQEDIVFNENDEICEYTGEMINNAELTKRYGRYTAPYAMQVASIQEEEGGLFEDGAIRRGIGTIINHSKKDKNADFVIQVINGRNTYIKLVATKAIRNGQEIYVDYTKGNDINQHYIFNEKNVFYQTVRAAK